MANHITLSDLLESRLLGDASHSTLDHLVSRDHQNKIALSITDWRSIAPFLGLEETDEEDIEVMYSSTKTRNIAMLRKWKHLHGSSATYRRLLGAFWDVERIDLIDKLLEMLAADTPLSPTVDNVETEDNEAMIYVKTLSGQRIVLEVISADTVEDLKTMLQHKLPVEERVETKKLRLIFQGQDLSDERLLCEYGIQNHSTVYQRLQTGTIQLCISLPDLGKFLPLTVKPATTFSDIVHRVVALERTLLPYQHLLVTLRGHSSVQLSAIKYASVVGEYDLKSEDTVELVACEKYCHSLEVTLPSLMTSETEVITLKLHSHDTFRTVRKLIDEKQTADLVEFYSNEMMLKEEELVGTFSRCYVQFYFVEHQCLQLFHYFSARRFSETLMPERIPLVFEVERNVGNRQVKYLRPSGSVVVYILKQKSVTLYLPDDNVSIYIIKELMREERPFTYYNDRPKVQLLQNNVKLTDDTILSECTSTKIEYNGSTILTYHLTAECREHCSVYYLNQSFRGYPAVCNGHVFSNDTIADLKAAIEESSGIPQQNQALYNCDSEYKPKLHNHTALYDYHKLELHNHQIVGDFVRYRCVYLDVRLLVFIKTLSRATIPFEVLSCDNVLSLKRMIAIETDIPVAGQTLLSDDTVLENTKSVGAYIENMKLTLQFTLVVSEVFFCSCL